MIFNMYVSVRQYEMIQIGSIHELGETMNARVNTFLVSLVWCLLKALSSAWYKFHLLNIVAVQRRRLDDMISSHKHDACTRLTWYVRNWYHNFERISTECRLRHPRALATGAALKEYTSGTPKRSLSGPLVTISCLQTWFITIKPN